MGGRPRAVSGSHSRDGSELAEQLRQSRPEMRVLFTSGFTDEAIAE